VSHGTVAASRVPEYVRRGALLAGALLLIAGCGPGASQTTPARPIPSLDVSAAGQAFPLGISASHRYLVDAHGRPFLIQGDTAWSLIADLNREDAERYLRDRAARGFNTLLVNLIEHHFSRNAPRNAYGDAPFTRTGDFSTPNEAYFAHADWVLDRARALGFVVLLVPAYLGYEGNEQGWYRDLDSSSAGSLLAYGRFLGQRYRSFDNIVWTYGGDYNPPNRDVVKRIATGIREFDIDAVSSAHNAPEHAALDYWSGEPWVTLNNVYTYEAVYAAALKQYQRAERAPFFLLESNYENEHGSTTRQLRMQAYHALLSGAAGHVFGNNPIWHFDGPGVFDSRLNWRQALDSPGSRSMTRLKQFFDTIEWWKLEPDTQGVVLTAGAGNSSDRAVAALSSDAALAIIYIPSRRDTGLNFKTLAGPRVDASWYDPVNGSLSAVAGSPFEKSSTPTLRPPHENSGGDEDWLLIVRSRP
jgi:hypothetical protein